MREGRGTWATPPGSCGTPSRRGLPPSPKPGPWRAAGRGNQTGSPGTSQPQGKSTTCTGAGTRQRFLAGLPRSAGLVGSTGSIIRTLNLGAVYTFKDTSFSVKTPD